LDRLHQEPVTIPQVRHRFSSFAICGPVLQEVVQGLDESTAARDVRTAMLALPRVGDPLDLDLFLKAVEIYRSGRRRGLTIRSTVDCLIAAIAIEHNVRVWRKDRDFVAIASYTGLRVITERLT
jgi:predicted nucleic acid-binding protein